jgi:general secretion pathway protein J
MRRRTGFTLIELVVALTLTGTVALLTYGSVQAGLDTVDRIERYQRNGEAVALLRTLVGDALRHPGDAPAGFAAFEFAHVNESDALQFISRGVSGPLGAGSLWKVSVRPGSHGLLFEATALERNAAPIAGEIQAVKSIIVRVRASGDDQGWQDRWDSTRQFPSAVSISFLDSLGVQVGAQMVISTGFGAR